MSRSKTVIRELEGMTDAQQASVLRKSQFADEIVRKAQEVEEFRQKWEACKQKEKQAKQLYEQCREEQDALINGGPPRPDPQMKLPLDTDLDVLALPGEIQDALITAGVEDVRTLGEIYRGNNADYDSVESIPGLTGTQADVIVSTYRSWFDEQEAKLENAVDDDDNFGDEAAESEGPDESYAEEYDSTELTKKAKVLTKIEDETCTLEEGDVVPGVEFEGGQGFHAILPSGERVFLNAGEYELVS